MPILSFMQPNEQAQRLEVPCVGRDRPRRILECSFVGTESLVAQPEDMERVRIFADVPEQLFQAADRRAVVLEPERVRRTAFQPRGA